MAGMRVQFSLQFADEDVFYNFIKPYKEQRLLNNVIIKCLSAYYYDKEVRDKVEGVSMGDATGESTGSSTQDICDAIRQALMMQDFMVQEMQDTVDTEGVTDILNQANEIIEESEVAKMDSGSNILKINMDVPESKEEKIDTYDKLSGITRDFLNNTLQIFQGIKDEKAQYELEIQQLKKKIESNKAVNNQRNYNLFDGACIIGETQIKNLEEQAKLLQDRLHKLSDSIDDVFKSAI